MKKTVTIITENYETTEKPTKKQLNDLINHYYIKGDYNKAIYYVNLKQSLYSRWSTCSTF